MFRVSLCYNSPSIYSDLRARFGLDNSCCEQDIFLFSLNHPNNNLAGNAVANAVFLPIENCRIG